jgi:hypothetical protein
MVFIEEMSPGTKPRQTYPYPMEYPELESDRNRTGMRTAQKSMMN